MNAAGPWVEELSNLAVGGTNVSKVRLVKGSHIITDKRFEGDHSYFFQNGDGRIMFAIPYEEGRMTLIGTTDELYTGNKDAVEISDEEVDYLISCANEYLKDPISREDVKSTYSGVRPLYDDQTENVSKVTRDYVLSYDDKDGAPILSIFGGKITTYRTLAEAVLKDLEPAFPEMAEPWTKYAFLPGGEIPEADFDSFLEQVEVRYPWCEKEHLKRLARAYGTRIGDILVGAESMNDLGQIFAAGVTEQELNYLVEKEFVFRAEDFLMRRSKLALHLNEQEQQEIVDWFDAKVNSERLDQATA